MKHYMITLLFSLVNLMPLAQKTEHTTVTIKLKNSSIFPKMVTIISYEPGDGGNGTQGFLLMPGSEKELRFKEGAKLYAANYKQIDSVMSGARIDNGKPFLTVKKEDNNKTFKL